MPASDVTITLGFASSIRVASDAAAKPPNTTECTAPMRAQASMANTASAIIGMYTSTRSPRPTPCSRRIAAKRFTSAWSCR